MDMVLKTITHCINSRIMHYSMRCISSCVLLCLTLNTQAKTPVTTPNTTVVETPIVQVHISGIRNPALENASKRLKVILQPLQTSANPQQVQFFYEQAKQQILTSIQPYGYFKATVTSKLKRTNQHWIANFRITPGPVMHVTRIKLDITGAGANSKPFQRLKKHVPLKLHAPLNTPDYDKTKQMFMDTAYKLGYFKAKVVKSHLRIYMTSYQAHIILHFDTGPRYYFGKTIFNSSRYNQSFLRRYMTYKAGDPYSLHKIQQMQLDLSNSPYFAQVLVNPKPNQHPPPHTVPVHIRTHSARSQRYSIGGGYGTDTGPRVTGTADFLRVTHSGQRLQLQSSYSPSISYALANYIIPGSRPAKNYYTLSTGVYHMDLSNVGKANSYKASIHYDTQIKGWKQTLGLTYLDEKYQFTGNQSAGVSPLLQHKQTASMLVPSVTWADRKVQGRKIPHAGYSISLKLSGANKDVLANSSFFQSMLSTKLLYTTPFHLRNILRAQIGYTHIDNLNHLPLSLQLMAGGADSIRGYDYQTIGPGRKLLVGSAELQQKIIGSLYLVGFYDVGNVSEHWSDKLKQSAGPGLAYLTSLGTFELTAAKVLQDPHKKWMVQFSIHPAI